jgi:hypothetical protein
MKNGMKSSIGADFYILSSSFIKIESSVGTAQRT